MKLPFLRCISGFSDCGDNTKRWEQEKKARGWGREWELNDHHRPPPSRPLPPYFILLSDLAPHSTIWTPGPGTSQFYCSMLCRRCSAVNLLFKSLAFQFLDALLCQVVNPLIKITKRPCIVNKENKVFTWKPLNPTIQKSDMCSSVLRQ